MDSREVTIAEQSQLSPCGVAPGPSSSLPGGRLVVRAAPREHHPWIVARTGCAVTGGFRAIEAIDSAGRIRGMIAYDLWTENAVQAHMAVDTPAAWRSLLGPAFSYPFVEAGKGLLIGVIPADNKKSLRMALRLGFTETYRMRDGWARGVPLVFLEMTRADCPWLQRRD